MKKILFVCLGNICRSPMAEFVMKDMLKRSGLSGSVAVASAATSAEEMGNPVHPGTRRKLSEHGISCAGKTARQLTRRDYDAYDYLIGMDEGNMRSMRRLFGGDPKGKLVKLLDRAKQSNPEQVLVVETPTGTVTLKIGDALIYEDPHGWVVIDSE